MPTRSRPCTARRGVSLYAVTPTSRVRKAPPALLLACLCLAGALAWSIAAPSKAHARKNLEIALQDEAVFLYQNYYNREQALQQARALGVTRLRINVLWSKAIGPVQAASPTKPNPITYNWGIYDSAIDAAARYGIRVTLTFAGQPVPVFARGKRALEQYKPKANRFKEFVSAAAAHFKGRVDTYSIWNEPNLFAWLTPIRQAGTVYRKLYLAGYKAIRRVDKRVKILIGETVPYVRTKRRGQAPLKFLRQLTCVNTKYKRIRRKKCKPLIADGYAHHPYEFTRDPAKPPRKFNKKDDATLGRIKKLIKALDKLKKAKALRTKRKKALDLYLHEFGYFNGGRGKILPLAKRSKFLVKAFKIAQRNRRIRVQLQYTFIQPPAGFPSGFFDLSLVLLNGGTIQPYNALAAYASAAARTRKVKRNPGPLSLPPAPP